MADVAAKAGLGQLEATLNEYFGKKAPALPANIKEVIVKIAPWLTVLGVVLSIPALLTLLGLGGLVAVTSPLAGVEGVKAGWGYMVSMVFLVVIVVLEGLAIPGLFARSRKGWTLIYYSVLVNVVSSIITLNIIGAALSLLVGGYFVFQVREYYK